MRASLLRGLNFSRFFSPFFLPFFCAKDVAQVVRIRALLFAAMRSRMQKELALRADAGATTATLCVEFGLSRHQVRRALRMRGVYAPRAVVQPDKPSRELLQVLRTLVEWRRIPTDYENLNVALSERLLTSGVIGEVPRERLAALLWMRLANNTGTETVYRPVSWSWIAAREGVNLDRVEHYARRLRRQLEHIDSEGSRLALELAFPQKVEMSHQPGCGIDFVGLGERIRCWCPPPSVLPSGRMTVLARAVLEGRTD
jgi:hypothetical protein